MQTVLLYYKCQWSIFKYLNAPRNKISLLFTSLMFFSLMITSSFTCALGKADYVPGQYIITFKEGVNPEREGNLIASQAGGLSTLGCLKRFSSSC